MTKLLAGCLIIAFGIILAYIFILFWIQGRVILMEPNKLVLAFETLMSFFIIIFGLGLFVKA